MICSKFITFAVTKTTHSQDQWTRSALWFAQNSLPLRWQRQLTPFSRKYLKGCDLLKIHYLCGDKDNTVISHVATKKLWFAQNSLPLRWQRQRGYLLSSVSCSCDLLKIHYLCGDKDNCLAHHQGSRAVVICSKFITFAVTKTTRLRTNKNDKCCDLLKIHYLCGDKDNVYRLLEHFTLVVICSKFITFAVTKTTRTHCLAIPGELWFAQNSLPLRWQRQHSSDNLAMFTCCDLLKIHYLCGDKDNCCKSFSYYLFVVICSKFITFAVTKTTFRSTDYQSVVLWFAQNSLPLRWQRQLSCQRNCHASVVICSKFITFAVTKTTFIKLHW